MFFLYSDVAIFHPLRVNITVNFLYSCLLICQRNSSKRVFLSLSCYFENPAKQFGCLQQEQSLINIETSSKYCSTYKNYDTHLKHPVLIWQIYLKTITIKVWKFHPGRCLPDHNFRPGVDSLFSHGSEIMILEFT